MPPGGDGFYYFSTYLTGIFAEFSIFDLQINGDVLCTVNLDQTESSADALQSACTSATYATAGTKIEELQFKPEYFPIICAVLWSMIIRFEIHSLSPYINRRHRAGCVQTWNRHDSLASFSILLLQRIYWIQDLSS